MLLVTYRIYREHNLAESACEFHTLFAKLVLNYMIINSLGFLTVHLAYHRLFHTQMRLILLNPTPRTATSHLVPLQMGGLGRPQKMARSSSVQGRIRGPRTHQRHPSFRPVSMTLPGRVEGKTRTSHIPATIPSYCQSMRLPRKSFLGVDMPRVVSYSGQGKQTTTMTISRSSFKHHIVIKRPWNAKSAH